MLCALSLEVSDLWYVDLVQVLNITIQNAISDIVELSTAENYPDRYR